MTITSNIAIGATAWASGQAKSIGNRVINSSKLYQASNAGNTGATAPTHTSGSVSDGGVTWLFLCTVNYTDISVWASGIVSPLTQPVVGQLWNCGEIIMSGSPWLSLNGHTTSSTNTITLCAAPGESFSDNAGTLLVYDSTKGVAIRRAGDTYVSTFGGNDGNIIIKGLQFKNDRAQGNAEGGFNGNLFVDTCLFDLYDTGITFGGGGTATNCIVYSRVTNGQNLKGMAFSSVGNATAYLYNCLFYREVVSSPPTSSPLYISYGNFVLVNCMCFNHTNISSGRNGSISWDYAITDTSSQDGTGPGYTPTTPTHSITNASASAQFISPGVNFNTKAGAPSIDAGNAISGIPAFDINKVARPQGTAWDIGPCEYVVAVAIVAGLKAIINRFGI